MRRAGTLLVAFLHRDFLEQVSYRTAFVLEIGGIFFSAMRLSRTEPATRRLL